MPSQTAHERRQIFCSKKCYSKFKSNLPIVPRLIEKIKKSKDGCWEILGKNKKEYGKISIKNRTVSAHKAMWIANFGPIKKGLCVCHKCDNRRCINPEHLFLGTYAENMADAFRKKRMRPPCGDAHWSRRNPEKVSRGSRRSNSVLTEKDIPEIFMLKRNGLTQEKIAKKFNIGQDIVSRILNKKIWKHVNVSS